MQPGVCSSKNVRTQVAIRCARNPWLAALLVISFFARALIPAGFMPGPGGLILCSGYAPLATGSSTDPDHGPSDMSAMDMSGMDMSSMDMSGMAMPGHSGDPSHGGNAPDHESMGICPFAAASSTMAAPHAICVAALARLIPTSIEFPPEQVIPRGTIVPTRLPRGPPRPRLVRQTDFESRRNLERHFVLCAG